MDASQAVFNNSLGQASTYPILAASFRSLSLFLLAFTYVPNDPSVNAHTNHSSPNHFCHISLVHQTNTTLGPHQYIALNARRDRAYTTTWGWPPVLSAWDIARELQLEHWRVGHINDVPITATSSYITLAQGSGDEPYTYAYSMGGPTGEVHAIDSVTGGFKQKLQEVLFVGSEELEAADKTRKALREGSHAIEFLTSSIPRLAFVPVLGTDEQPGTIEVYEHDPATGLLTHRYSAPPPRVGHGHDAEGRSSQANDGPRHVKVHPSGKTLYCVTEHSNRIDIYTIDATSKVPLTYLASHSLMPLRPQEGHYRGSTLQFAPSTPRHPAPRAVIATTRGGSLETMGWVGIHRLDDAGVFQGEPRYHELPSSGGKSLALAAMSKPGDEDKTWVLLSDDAEDAGGVSVLEWDHETDALEELATWRGEAGVDMQGSSFSVWLD